MEYKHGRRSALCSFAKLVFDLWGSVDFKVKGFRLFWFWVSASGNGNFATNNAVPFNCSLVWKKNKRPNPWILICLK